MLGLYVHIPFCSKKCYYCDFASYVNSEHLIDEYIDALLKELNLYKDKKFDTVFVGGGTPSYLDDKKLEKLLLGVNKNLINSNILEFTIECNPGTITYEKLNIMKSYGVNRLSIGLQSVNDKTLKFIGRIHNFNDFDQGFNLARAVGFKNINVDLIFAIPCENINDYEKSLNIISEYDLNHVSAYNLILEKNTKFYSLFKKDEFRELDENTQIGMYECTKKILGSIGLRQYEISNYAKVGNECLHNLIYWNFNDYIGVGVSAHSFYHGNRFENTKNIKQYISMLKEGKHSYFKKYDNSLSDNIEEYVMLGLRKIDGFSIKDFENRFRLDIFDVFSDQIKKYKKLGFLNFDDDRIYLNSKGIVLMNYILKDFILDKKN